VDTSVTQKAVTKNMSLQLIPCFGLGSAAGFLLWIIFSGTGELQQVQVGLQRYLFFLLPVGLAAASVVCALLWLAGAWSFAVSLSYVSCVFYFSFLKVLGWDFIPWVLMAVAVIVVFRNRKLVIEAQSSLLLLHAMGSLAGLYMAFNLGKFLQPWEFFMETVQSLWLLVIG